jgi:hypothetical protein
MPVAGQPGDFAVLPATEALPSPGHITAGRPWRNEETTPWQPSAPNTARRRHRRQRLSQHPPRRRCAQPAGPEHRPSQLAPPPHSQRAQ